MRQLLVLAACGLALTASGCRTGEVYARADPDRKLVCDELNSSLNADLEVGGFLSIVGFNFRKDVANDITEQRLEALKRMIAHCRAWSLGEISSEVFSQRLAESSSVYVADVPERDASIRARMALLETGLARLDAATREQVLRTSETGGRSLGGSGAAQLLASMSSRNRQANVATRSDVDALGEQARVGASLAPDLEDLKIRVARLEQATLDEPTEDENEGRPSSDTVSDRRWLASDPPPGSVSVFFNTGEYTLGAEAMAEIDDFISKFDSASDLVVVQGFADIRGEPDANLRLSQRRAASVINYLAAKGVQPSGASGFGETDDFSPDTAGNRRVTIEIHRPSSARHLPGDGSSPAG